MELPPDVRALIAGLQRELAELRAENAALKQEVADLRRQLGKNSSNSSKGGDQQQQHTENLGQTSIELMMLAIVRYVRHLDTTVHALHIKTRLCQLVEAMMKRRDDLAFR